MPAPRPRRLHCLALTVAAVLLGLVRAPLQGQSLTEGSLGGLIALADGTPVPGASLTLEDAAGVVVSRLNSDFRGRFTLALLAPGRYALLVEKAGYQPLRQRGIDVAAAASTQLTVRVARRPPPISQVEESAVAEQRLAWSMPSIGGVLTAPSVPGLTPRSEIAELGRNAAYVAGPRDATSGFATMFGGLPQSHARLLVDGLAGSWFRHPGLDTDAGGTPVFGQALFGEAQAFTDVPDAELVGGNGGMVTAVSRRGTNRFRFAPYASWSGAIGQPAIQNPADSSVSSFMGGGTVSGTLIPDRASYIVGAEYQSLDVPSSNPWDNDASTFAGGGASLRGTITRIAEDSFGRSVGRFVAPVVRHTVGGAGGFRVDWRLSNNHVLMTRANFARHTETSPEAPGEVLNGAAAGLDSRDFSSIVSVVSTLGANMANEIRFGIRRTTRNWSGSSIPTTYFVADGAGIGASAALPAEFERKSIDLSETFQYSFGTGAVHRAKLGLQYSNGTWDQDYLYGAGGIFSYGSLDGFSQGRGAFFVADASNTHTRTSVEEVALFAQVIYRLSPGLSAFGGIRWDRQKFPRQVSGPIKGNPQFGALFGIPNARVPDDKNNVGPRIGLLFEGGASREWTGGLALSRQYGVLNPATFAEARLNDGGVVIRRGVGTFGAWPALPDSLLAPAAGQQITLFSPDPKGYKNPRTFKADLELSRAFASGLTVRGYGGYHHTDFLLRRSDLNILSAPTGFTQEGRAVYGTLVQDGGMVVVSPGTNRAIPGFDLVSALASTGFQDHYEAGVSIGRESPAGLSFMASYTFSRTRDNWLLSWTGDPSDALSPFPEDRVGHEWAEGVSDLDVPHRAVLLASWRTAGSVPVTVAARYRFRSGLPFTPGFRPGVDANGDGSGRNDPAYVDDAIPGLSQVIGDHDCLGDQVGHMAKRNSCRSDANHALDLSTAVGLPLRSLGGRVELTVDVLNLVSTPVGIVDRALVLVDPTGTLATDPQGNVTLPLIANPRFGRFLSRRTEPRMVRFGLRLAY
ncbi:MAG: carboxypeptidase regulatory-like domain-containing protein [Gemmatimonadales bacterium]